MNSPRKPFFKPLLAFLLTAGLLAVLAAPPAQAQFWKKVKDRVKDEVEERVDKNIDQGVEKSADALEGGLKDAIRCVIGDAACIDEAQQQGKTVVLTDEDGTVQRNAQGNPITATEAGSGAIEGANANYDFEAGERTLFAEDFASDNVGDFPRRLYYMSGTAEVVDFQGRRFLRATSGGVFQLRLDGSLPETFTLELDAQVANGSGINMYFAPPVRDDENRPFRGYKGNYLNVGNWRGSGLWSSNKPKSVKPFPKDEVIPVRIHVDGDYVKMYAGTDRIANVPRADLGRHNAVTFAFRSGADRIVYIGNIRLAGGGKDLYDALESEGRVAVQDILFDTGQATIKTSSAKALQEIATVLTEHADLRLLVEGHTDGEGGFESNMTLSKARAEAVRVYLVENHGIDGARLKAMGLGQTQPAASNDSEAGRAENRRVELVRM